MPYRYWEGTWDRVSGDFRWEMNYGYYSTSTSSYYDFDYPEGWGRVE